MPDVPDTYIASIAATEVLDHYLPSNKTGLFIRNISRWPTFIHPMLVYYERLCLNITEALWNRSLLQWMIKK
jgi:hypothetical protein